ncbi:hypothetical protein [Echinicola sp. 20G]|uniref:hypothetical protein n=1 Tax=Echinicola sp. 20G TaxID=2781961 RepID=UPI0019108D84|nr:hypothetical protein [Echinicola sp. 20G]
MIQTISWQQFIVSMAGLLTIYYAYVIIMYFRKELLDKKSIWVSAPLKSSKNFPPLKENKWEPLIIGFMETMVDLEQAVAQSKGDEKVFSDRVLEIWSGFEGKREPVFQRIATLRLRAKIENSGLATTEKEIINLLTTNLI